MKNINTQKFVQWLKEREQEAKHFEAAASKAKDYIKAHEYECEANAYEWIRYKITGEDDTDIGEFME